MPERATPGDDDWSAPSPWGGADTPGPVPGPNPWEPRGVPAGPPGAGSSVGSSWGGPSANPPRGGESTGSAWGGGPAAAPGPTWSGSGTPTLQAPAGSGSPIGPPTVVLLIGLVLPLAALGLWFVGSLTTNIVGWALAVFGSVIPLAVFTRIDLQRRLSGWYIDRRGLLPALRVAVLLAGLLVAGWFAYLIADEVARWEIWFR